jgi:hypothetical protein
MYGQQFHGHSFENQTALDSSLSFLKQLNRKELQDLVDNSAQLNTMVDELEVVKTQEMEKETQLATNKSIAVYNLSREPRLIQCRQQLSETYSKRGGLKNTPRARLG